MSLEILGLKSIARFCSGMWDYLTARVTGRTVVELEKERNRGTVEDIRALPPGAELYESEPNGRTRIIRIPHTGTAAHPPMHTSPIVIPDVIESAPKNPELPQ